MKDQEIIALYWKRDENAIKETKRKYEPYLFKIAQNILNDSRDSEECINDTYFRAWNAMPPHRPSVLSAFLGKLTRNLSINRYKHSTAEKRGGGNISVVLDEITDLVSDTDTVEQEIDRRELVREIDRFLAGLSPDKRNIFVCRYWYFDSISDIASRFGKTENHISVILNRLRSKLHDHLLKRGFDL